MAASVLCYSLFTLAGYFADDARAAPRPAFLACLGVGGAWPGAVALVSEAWPEASRPLLAGLLGAAANFGFVFLGVAGVLLPGTDAAWRWPLLVGAAPAALGVLILLARARVAALARRRAGGRRRRRGAAARGVPAAAAGRARCWASAWARSRSSARRPTPTG